MSKVNCEIVFSSKGVSGAEKNLLTLKSDSRVLFRKVAISGVFVPKENALSLADLFAGGTLTSLYGFLYKKRDAANVILYAIGVKALAFCLLRRFFNKDTKIILGLRWSLQDCWRDRILLIMINLFERKIDYIISNSGFALDGIKSGINKTCIYNGISVRNCDIKTELHFSGRLCFVGSIEERKRIFELIKAMHVAGLFEKYTLNILGIGDQLSVIRDYVTERNLCRSVVFEGYLSDVNSHLKHYDILVLPSLKGEGCPTVLLEARALKVPVIYYESEGIGEQQVNGVTGIGLRNASIKEITTILQDYNGLNEQLLTLHRALLNEELEYTKDRFQKLHIQILLNV